MPRLFGRRADELQKKLDEAEEQRRQAENAIRIAEEERRRERDARNAAYEQLKRDHEERERIRVDEEKAARAHDAWLKAQEDMKKADKENERLRKLRQRTPEAIRRLRQLIRTRYELDCSIWVVRGAQEADHDLMYQDMVKADAILNEILAIVKSWDESGWDPEDWALAKRIKERLAQPVKRLWQDTPPWQQGQLV